MRRFSIARALILSVSFSLSVDSPTPAEPLGTGLLGATEAQIAKKLGVPDAKIAERYKNMEPFPPAVRLAFYPWKVVEDTSLAGSLLAPRNPKVMCYMAFGFDENGIARNVQLANVAINASVMGQFRSAVAPGWTGEKDGVKAYPSVDNATLGISNYIHWQDSGVGIKWGRSYGKVDRIDREGVFRTLSVSKNHEIYSMCEVYYNSRSATQFWGRMLLLADADSFWQGTLEELVRQWKDGLPKADPKEDRPLRRPYEVWVANAYRKNYDDKAVIADRLTGAVVAMVRNPNVDLRALGIPTQLVAGRHDQTLSKQLLTILQSAPETGPLRDRTATALGYLDDPAMVEPLIKTLRTTPPSKTAAKALQQFTGQELGADADAWQKWWTDNRKMVQAGYDARMRERTSGLKVARTDKTKLYHVPTAENGSISKTDCPELLKANGFRVITLGEAREAGLQPCPKCKPMR